MSQGFSVNARQLAGGSQDIGELLDRCEVIATDAVQAMVSMGACAGHAGLAAALGGAAEQGTRTFLDMGAAYQKVSGGLTATAQNYRGAEEDLALRCGAIVREMG